MTIPRPDTPRYKLAFWIFLSLVALGILIYFRTPVWNQIRAWYNLFSDREWVETFITKFGPLAPVIFMSIQIMQVLLAPIPGEATGFIGGYLFGALPGFIYSSIALTIGSWINFGVGRFLGKRYVRKIIPAAKLEKFDHLLRRQGLVIIFILFVFPGFPKDYLCLFLGFSTLPMRAFIFMAGVGRMPGTLMLSLQGSLLYKQSFGTLALTAGIFLGVAVFAWCLRERLYAWIEKINHKK